LNNSTQDACSSLITFPGAIVSAQKPRAPDSQIKERCQMTKAKPGLYANIHAKQERIANGSKEHMRSPSDPAAPSSEDFEKAKKPAKAKKATK